MLAGKMKLTHFLILAGLAGAAVCGGAMLLPVGGLFAWSSSRPAPTPVPLAAATPVSVNSVVSSPVITPAPQAAPALGSNPWDDFLIKKAGQNIGTDKVKDATKGTSYKINLYQDSGKASINRAKIDIDRDDKWDEKWTYEDGKITREVAPNDDENYTQKFAWNGSGWSAQ